MPAETAMLGAAVQKAVQRLKQFRLVEQKSVVAVVGGDLYEADIRRRRIERVHDLAAFRGWKEPIARKRDDAETRAASLEHMRQRAAMLGSEIEIIHRTGDIEIRIRVEAIDKCAALMAQIALDLEIGVETVGNLPTVLQIAPEFAMERGLR